MSQEITAAVLNTAPGRLELEKLYIDDPEAQEVRIRVEYAGLCHSDLHEIDGTFETQVPILLGHEAVGIIDMVGEAVDQFTPGDRVDIAPPDILCCASIVRAFRTIVRGPAF